ncbi:MAG: RNB domain-containing ribonuclease, partial [Candidatus Dadabacteria bacterium]|nr:RNB domain-containing ribonuclease [Candidatus Dadabacteria bacterium]
LHGVYRALRKQRNKRGAIDFETIETMFTFDKDKKIKAIHPRERYEAHMIIEECMISANISAAKFILKRK